MSLDQGLELIRQKFLVKLQGLVPGFEAFASRLEEQLSDKDDMTAQRVFVHQIAGSARTFGFPETSELAAHAEEFIDILLGDRAAQGQETEEIVAEAVRALRRLASHSKEMIATQLTAAPVAEESPKPEEASSKKASVEQKPRMSPDQGLDRIRQKFLVKLQGPVPGFEAFASRLEEETSDKEDMTQQRISVHQIAGSARTFGFPETSELAAHAEEFIDILLGDRAAQGQETEEVVAEAVRALRRLASHSKEMIATQLTAAPVAEESPKPEEAPSKKASVEQKYRILICDDDTLMGDLMREAFEGEDCKVIEVRDGAEVVDTARSHQPDLIIQDVNMPGFSGFDVLTALKSDKDTQDIPVVMLTRRTEDSSILKGISGGAVDYFFKPFVIGELVSKIMNILRRAKTTILLIDDDALVREVIAQRLRKLGWGVLEADNGQSGLTLFSDAKPNLVVLDLMMPGMDGISVLKQIKSSPGKMTPVVVISTKGQTQNVIGAIEAGAHDYLIKPFDLDELVARVAGILRRREQAYA